MRTEHGAASRFGLGVIVVLYMAHALPLYFYNVAVPAILRSQGVDLRWIGMLSLLYLPWAFKFLWAPLVDRWHLPALGRRRSWLWLTQLLMPVEQSSPTANCPADGLLQALSACKAHIALVSNEIGLGVIPLGAQTRAFVDALGSLNQRVAAVCSHVTLMVAGLPLPLKSV